MHLTSNTGLSIIWPLTVQELTTKTLLIWLDLLPCQLTMRSLKDSNPFVNGYTLLTLTHTSANFSILSFVTDVRHVTEYLSKNGKPSWPSKIISQTHSLLSNSWNITQFISVVSRIFKLMTKDSLQIQRLHVYFFWQSILSLPIHSSQESFWLLSPMILPYSPSSCD